MRFEEPFTSVSDQIALLKKRGMVIDDDASAEHYLKFISYYRLRAYRLPLEVPDDNAGGYTFREGKRFDDVLALYIFDRELRLLVLDAVERVEIALRARWAHHMAMTHGPHGYLEQVHYALIARHAEALSELNREFRRSRDTFAVHYRKKYTSPKLPPIWMAAEVMSFGLLSKFYGNLKLHNERQAIAKPFGLDEKALTCFAHHISHVRNICAHHGRLWNKRFTVKMAVPKYPAKLPFAMCDADPRHLHNTLVVLGYLLSVIAPCNQWKPRVIALIDGYALAEPASMGFSGSWRTRPAWMVA